MNIVVMVAMCVLLIAELVSVVRAGLGAAHAPSRLRLAVVGVEAIVVLIVTRAIAPWDAVTQWIWVAAVGGVAGGLLLVAFRWLQVPVVAPGIGTARTVGSALYLMVLAGLGLLVVSTFR